MAVTDTEEVVGGEGRYDDGGSNRAGEARTRMRRAIGCDELIACIATSHPFLPPGGAAAGTST